MLFITMLLTAYLITYPIKHIFKSQFFSTFIFVLVCVYASYSFCLKIILPLPESEQPSKEKGFLNKLLSIFKNRPCDHGLKCSSFIFMLLFLVVIGFTIYKQISYYGRRSPQSYIIILTIYYFIFLLISYFIISGYYNSLLKN